MPDTQASPPARIQYPGLLVFAIVLGMFEGGDLASIGLTLSRLSKALALDPAQGGFCASAAMLGLTIGAIIGGRFADLHGRRPVLIVSMLLLGAFAFATSMAWNFESLLVARLLTGLGMGGLMPVLIAMAADSARPGFRSSAISALMASGGFGAIMASIVSLYPDWRVVFYVGGLGPLLMVPVLLLWLRPGRLEPHHDADAARAMRFGEAMFGDRRVTGTALIWTIAFCTTLVSYVLLNWLPSLLVRQGVGETQSHAVMIAYSIGGIGGNLAAGMAMDRGGARFTYIAGYVGAVMCIAGLAVGFGIGGVFGLAFGVNFFILGAQLATFALTPVFYPEQARTTGIGAMVSAGRLGSVVGPIAVGQLLHAGLTANQVLVGLIPGLLLSLVLGLWLAALVRGRPAPATIRADLAVSAA
jgi:AAHS family 3-hydroxyphenylpropionic acid transporter